jgi:DNA-binding NarL/FixJ family response regulator
VARAGNQDGLSVRHPTDSNAASDAHPSRARRRAPAPGSLAAAATPQPIRVAIVDDEQLIAELVALRLADTPGIVVVGMALSGEAALTLVAEQRPDVLVLDLAMPGMDGVDVARQVRARFPEVAIVVLTGHASPMWERPLRELHVEGYLAKTVGTAELVATIRAAAEHRARS